MPYDQLLAGRVRHALQGRTDVVEKAMFGGLTFMVSGNMCCGVNRDDLIIRLDARTTTDELNSPHARPWDFMPSRPMPGIFAIRAEGNADQSAVDRWVALALKPPCRQKSKAQSPRPFLEQSPPPRGEKRPSDSQVYPRRRPAALVQRGFDAADLKVAKARY